MHPYIRLAGATIIQRRSRCTMLYRLVLMTVLAQTLFALMNCHLVTLVLLTVWHFLLY